MARVPVGGAASNKPPPSVAHIKSPDSDYGFVCKCDERFTSPAGYLKHMATTLHAGEPKGKHGARGLMRFSTGEVVFPWGGRIWGQYRSWLAAYDEASPAATGGNGAGAAKRKPSERKAEEASDGDGRSAGGEKDGRAPLQDSPGPLKSAVKVMYRPQVFEIDESLVLLYHLCLTTFQQVGSTYRPSFGVWMRDTCFRFHVEHPELVDLRAIFTPRELAILKQGGEKK